MATVSTTLPSDGSTIDAADVNVPINAILTQVNGNLDSNNLADTAVTPAKILAGTGTSWTWQNWTPSYSGITVGDGTAVAKYTQIGKTVHFMWQLTCGGTTSISNGHTISIPVAAASYHSTTNVQTAIGNCFLRDVGTASYIGMAALASSTTVMTPNWPVGATAGTIISTSTNFPIAEASGDTYTIIGTYEAA